MPTYRTIYLLISGLALTSSASPAHAHFFAQPYTLPVPFAMYAWGATAALILSFVVVGVFAGVPNLRLRGTERDAPSAIVPSLVVRLGQAGAVIALAVCLITGWFGTQIALENLGMTLFWIVFVLFVPYSCALVGDYYAAINPWRVLVNALEKTRRKPFTGLLVYPERLSYWPALAFYAAFIWIELFAELLPRGLANALLIYTVLNVVGAWVFGAGPWFRYGEFFGVFLRLIGSMAPVAWQADDASSVRISWRAPFSELVAMRAESLAMAVFILFMLSSTAYDGLHATEPWVTWFWRYVYPPVAPLLDSTTAGQIAAGTRLYHGWQKAMLLVSPVVYLAVFWACITLAKRLSRSKLAMRDLILWFAPSLIPIAFVYHVTHYYTILLYQGSQLVRLVSDPFGVGWDIFGTASSSAAGFMIEVDLIWHSQVGLILLGHIISVYLAHVTALRIFGGARTSAASQAPMLALMVLFTTFGLWILSLPLTAGG